MDNQTIISGLKDLIRDREIFGDENDPDCVFFYDKKVLEGAVKIIEAAPEVEAQELPSININQLRIENGLKPIPNGDCNFIATKLSENL